MSDDTGHKVSYQHVSLEGKVGLAHDFLSQGSFTKQKGNTWIAVRHTTHGSDSECSYLPVEKVKYVHVSRDL